MQTNMVDKILITFILFLGFTSTLAGSYCYNYDSWENHLNILWCDDGCCGTYRNVYCCNSALEEIFSSALRSIFVATFFVVSAIVALCCCCWRTRGRNGHVIQRVPGQTTTVPMHNHPYRQVGYNCAVNFPVKVTTTYVAPETTQHWQQQVAPPKYEEAVSYQQ